MNIEDKIRLYAEQMNPNELGFKKIEDVKIIGDYSGESNHIYFIDINGIPFLFKINGISGKDPDFFEKEFHKLKSLEQYAIAPRAFIYDGSSFDNPFMILERIVGRTLKPKEVPLYLRQTNELLNKMVTISSKELKQKKGFKRDINSCFDFVQIFPKHASEQLKEYAIRFGKDETYKLVYEAHSKSLKYIEDKKHSFNDSEMGLIHTGLHPENIILTPEGNIKFIDWEHSGIGDLAFEISSFLRSNGLTRKQQRDFLNNYQGKTGEFAERIDLYTELFKVHEVLWHSIRYDKARKGELNLKANKTPEYYWNLFLKHTSALKDSKILRFK